MTDLNLEAAAQRNCRACCSTEAEAARGYHALTDWSRCSDRSSVSGSYTTPDLPYGVAAPVSAVLMMREISQAKQRVGSELQARESLERVLQRKMALEVQQERECANEKA